MVRLLTLIVSIAFASPALATIQKSDIFFHRGLTFNLDSTVFPMQEYFDRHSEKRKAMTDGLPWSSVSTNLWRGHVATYYIVNGKLALKDLVVPGPGQKLEGYSGDWFPVMNRVFPNDEVLFVDWFTDLLILPLGEDVYSLASSKRYGRYLVLNIQSGILLSEYVTYGSPSEIRNAHRQDKLENYANRVFVSCRVKDSDLSDVYVGDCKDGLAHGEGLAVGRDEYRGDFLEGTLDGEGIYTWGPKSDWPSERHEGTFKNGQKEGFGETIVNANSNHMHLEWYRDNAKLEGENYVLRGLFVNHEFVLACDSPADCQRKIELIKSSSGP